MARRHVLSFSRIRFGVCVCAVWLAVAVVPEPPLFAADAGPAPARKLLVVSVDGLDWRYLRDRDSLNLSIPNLRRLLARSEVADGVVGVWPTVTWPSHTSIITGVRPDQHGILSNGSGPVDPASSYWSAKKIKVPTLLQCAAAHNLTTAAVTWPVTMDANITYNLPEVFVRRAGGSMDLETIAAYATPGLVADIAKASPSFPQQWMDDRTRAVATVYLLQHKAPDLILLHFVELDSESHAQGPFGVNAKAILERTDELIGKLLEELPENYDLALVSDHGFERVDRQVNLPVMAAAAGVTGDLKVMDGIVFSRDLKVAQWLRTLSARPGSGIGREIPRSELTRYAPGLAGGYAFEPADHIWFGDDNRGPAAIIPERKGKHGYWPLRHDYHSVYLRYGPGIKASRLSTLEMTALEDRLAASLGISCAK
jgi:predicted AlkP superfamily pyrophosphatase or phosphodiesterase